METTQVAEPTQLAPLEKMRRRWHARFCFAMTRWREAFLTEKHAGQRSSKRTSLASPRTIIENMQMRLLHCSTSKPMLLSPDRRISRHTHFVHLDMKGSVQTIAHNAAASRNGDRYSGEYSANKVHGFVVYHFANGHFYEGSWHKGWRHGLGTYTYQNGKAKSGEWDSGVLKNTMPESNPSIHRSFEI